MAEVEQNNELKLLPESRPDVERRKIPLGILPSNDELLGPDAGPELVNAIRSVGLLQPIVIGERNGEYHVHGGRRRIKAFRKLHAEWEKQSQSEEGTEEAENPWSHIDSYVVDDNGYEAHETLTILMHSTQRPNAVAELDAIDTLFKKGASEEEMHKKTGLPTGTIRARKKLLNLDPDLKLGFKQGKMSMSVAEKAARLPRAAQERLAEKLAENDKLTGPMVEEQMRARTQQAAASASLDFSDVPTAQEIDEYQVDLSDSQEAAQERSPEIEEAVTYLRERLQLVQEGGRDRRPKWTRKDVDTISTVLEYLET